VLNILRENRQTEKVCVFVVTDPLGNYRKDNPLDEVREQGLVKKGQMKHIL